MKMQQDPASGQQPGSFYSFEYTVSTAPAPDKLYVLLHLRLMFLLRTLTRAPLGYLAERALLGMGQILHPPPLPNSRTGGPGEEGGPAIETLDEFFLNNLKKILKGNMPGQGQVKSQNLYFLPYRL